MRITEEQSSIFEKALDAKEAFTLDWKSAVEDIVFNVKDLIPDIEITASPEKQEYGDWFEPMTVNGDDYSFKSESPTLILDVISTINTYLSKLDKVFVQFDTEDDSYNFILISLADLPSYLDKGFKEV
jgi:hypothetical protein